MRTFFMRALAIAIRDLNNTAVDSILAFCQRNLLILTVMLTDVELLILSEAYSTMRHLVEASVQVEKPRP